VILNTLFPFSPNELAICSVEGRAATRYQSDVILNRAVRPVRACPEPAERDNQKGVILSAAVFQAERRISRCTGIEHQPNRTAIG
jgi:hypothetical protein